MATADLRTVTCAIGVAAAIAGSSVGAAGAAPDRSSSASGRPPSPTPYGVINFAGSFANAGWAGFIRISVSPNGRQVTSLTGIAPGPCDDRDFGEMLPGRDGASGAEFNSYRSAAIRADGAFSNKNLRSSRGQRAPKLSGTFSINGTFSGDVVRGQVEATATTSYDTCTANVRFTARRVGP